MIWAIDIISTTRRKKEKLAIYINDTNVSASLCLEGKDHWFRPNHSQMHEYHERMPRCVAERRSKYWKHWRYKEANLHVVRIVHTPLTMVFVI